MLIWADFLVLGIFEISVRVLVFLMKQRAATTRALRVFLGSCEGRSPCLKKHNIYEGIVPFTVCICFLFVLVFFSSESLACYGNEKISSENYNWILELEYFVEYLEIRINQTYNENNWKSERNFGAYIGKSRLFLVNLGNHMR